MAYTYSLDLERGSSQYAYIDDASQTGLDITGDFTIEAWINLESLPGANTYVVCAKENVGGNERSFGLSILNDKLRCAYFNLPGESFTLFEMNETFVSGDLGNWIHVAVAVDVSAQTAAFYKNGTSMAYTLSNAAATSVKNSNAPVGVGTRQSSSSYADFFDGKISDVRVWNDIRTATEIATNMNVELAGSETGLAANWKLDNAYTDSTSNANTLTSSGSPTFAEDVPPVGDGIEIVETTFSTDGNLQGYWQLESDGTDSSSNSYDLTGGGTPTHAAAKFNNGVDLETTSSQYYYIADASCPNLEITGSQSWSAWIKAESLVSQSRIIAKTGAAGANPHTLYLPNTAGNISFYLEGLSTNITSSIKILTGVWYHVCGVYDSSGGTLALFVNGVKKSTSVTGTITDSNGNFAIGRDGSTAQYYFDGIVDDVAIFDRALTDDEVISIRTGTATLLSSFVPKIMVLV